MDFYSKKKAIILFNLYPKIKKAYHLAQKLKHIYDKNQDKNIARLKLDQWYKEVENQGFKSFYTISRTIQNHYENILNYFNNRSINTSAESSNVKKRNLETNLEV